MIFDPDVLFFIFAGIKVTLLYTFLSLTLGLPLGMVMAVCKISHRKTLRSLANGYTAIFRGTPLLVQLGMMYYGIPQLLGYKISVFEAGILTFTLNSAAYTSEIMRTGITSIDTGQWEAAKILGLTRWQTMRYIIAPQALRIVLPALVNEMVDLLKESALIATLSEMDILRRAQMIAAERFAYFEPYLIAAVAYFILVSIFNVIAKQLEKRLSYA